MRRYIGLWRAVLALMPVLALGVTSAQAGDADQPDGFDENGELHFTIHKAAPTLSDLARSASQGEVSAQRLADWPAYREGELLETVPGLIVTQHSGEGKANQYFLRGFNLDHGTDIAISIDGMPVNLPTNAHGQGYADLNFMIPELVRTIQYSKGPYYAAKGDFDTAGSVDITYIDTLPYTLGVVSAGTLGDYRAMGAQSVKLGSGDLLMAMEYAHADGPWTISDNYNKGNLLLRYSQGTATNGLTVTGMFMDDAWHALNQIPLRGVNSGQIGLYGTVDPTDGGSSQRYSLSTRWIDTDERRRITLNAYAVGSALELYNDFDYFVTYPPPIGDQFRQHERRKIFGGGMSYTRFDQFLGRAADTTFGFQTRTDDINVGLDETQNRSVLYTIRNDHIFETSNAVYAENVTKWFDKVRSTVGLREDVFYGSDHSTPYAANSGTSAKGMLSPKASLTLGPWRETEFYLSYGQGFHSNDLRGAVTKVDATSSAQTGAIVTQGNTPFLTKAEGYEIGMRSHVTPDLRIEAALFVLNLASEATFDGDSAGTAAGRPSRRIGLELGANYMPLPWLAFDGDFAFTRARFTDTDNGAADVEPGHPGSYVPEAAKMIASAGITITNLGEWDGGLRFRYFGPRPLIEDGSVRSSPTALFDARVGYRLSDRFKLSLDIYNLFNSRAHQIDYFYPSQLANETSPVYDIHFKPVEPLSARLTLRGTF